MARPDTPQRDKRTKAVKTASLNSNSVQILRQAVADLCDVVDKIDERLAVLERVPKSSSGSAGLP